MKKLSPIPVYLIFNGSRELFFAIVFTASMVYQVTVVKLNPLQLVLVGTTLEASIFLFEIPTGVVADVYSRRLSVIIGVFLIGAGFILEGSIPHFGPVILAQVFWGIGYTFTSGAIDAWIADDVGEAAAGQAFLQGSQAGIAGGLAGTLIGTVLGSIRINLPIQLGGSLFLLLGFFLILYMPEGGFIPKARQADFEVELSPVTAWKGMLETFKSGIRLVRTRSMLITILLIGIFFGLYSEGYDRLWTAHLIEDIGIPEIGGLKPVVWIGAIGFSSGLLSLGALALARRKLNPGKPVITLYVMTINRIMVIGSLIIFAFTRSFPLAVGLLCLISVMRSVNNPYYTAWVNMHLSSEVRATVLSMSSQVDALGQIAGGPVLGLIGNTWGIPAALMSSAALLSPVLILLGRAWQRERRVELEPLT